MSVDFVRNLKITLDVLVPLVSIPLTLSGLAGEAYQYHREFPIGSHVPEIAGGISAFALYFGFLRRKLSESNEAQIDFLRKYYGGDFGA